MNPTKPTLDEQIAEAESALNALKQQKQTQLANDAKANEFLGGKHKLLEDIGVDDLRIVGEAYANDKSYRDFFDSVTKKTLGGTATEYALFNVLSKGAERQSLLYTRGVLQTFVKFSPEVQAKILESVTPSEAVTSTKHSGC